MKLRTAFFAILCLGLVCCLSSVSNQAYAQGKVVAKVVEQKITVLNPMGTPPPVTVKPMAETLSTLDGKTIYFVNTGFVGTDRLMEVMTDWFKANYPKANIVTKVNRSMDVADKQLWAEIGEKADGVVIGLGH